jgi:tetratricopeptide (TPR) repeat protein
MTSAGNVVADVVPDADLATLAALTRTSRHAELESRATDLLGRYPNAGLLYKLLGFAQWAQGKDAIAALTRASELLPNDAESHGNLGNALRAAGQFEKAIMSQRRAVALEPAAAEAHNNLGSALQDLGRIDEALEQFRRAVALKPGFALAHSNLANALGLQGRIAEAETSCRRALELKPGFTPAMVQLAEMHAARGQFQSAETLLTKIKTLQPDAAEAWAGIARLKRMTRADEGWLAEALRLVEQGLPARREVHLRYALGKYYDDVGEYAAAFVEYRRANELAKGGRPVHDRSAVRRAVDRLIQFSEREGWRGAPGAANPSERPVFIVGMPRSGTTLAEQILASHRAVAAAGELPFWNTAAARVAAGEPSGLPELARQYLGVLEGVSSEALRVVDKMPGNFWYLGMIHGALPRARIIHLQRDPRDTCLSIYFQNFGAVHSYANDLEDLAHYYGEYARLMRHWRESLPAQVLLEVRYEELVEDLEGSSRRMLEFLGLPWEPACLEFHRTARPVATFSKWQARQRINSSSVARWRHYADFFGALFDRHEEPRIP